MNQIASFRLCTLSNDELLKKVDSLTDEMYKNGKIHTRHIPARHDSDYDLLIGELILRFSESQSELQSLRDRVRELEECAVLCQPPVSGSVCYKECSNTQPSGDTDNICLNCGSSIKQTDR